MAWNPYPPVPAGPLRDLLGVTRAMYRAAADEQPPDEARLQALEAIGASLRTALRLATAPPGTLDHGTAWAAAERATRGLTELVAQQPTLAALIEPTTRRIQRPGSMV
jgi:hypothetical protein